MQYLSDCTHVLLGDVLQMDEGLSLAATNRVFLENPRLHPVSGFGLGCCLARDWHLAKYPK